MKRYRCMGPSNAVILYVRKLSSGINGFVQGHTGTLSGLYGVVISLSPPAHHTQLLEWSSANPVLLHHSPAWKAFVAPMVSSVRAVRGKQLAGAQRSIRGQAPTMRNKWSTLATAVEFPWQGGRKFGFNSQLYHYNRRSQCGISPPNNLDLDFLICKMSMLD